MSIRTLLLVFAALVPAVVLCIYVYKHDKVEKEPVWLLLLLLVLGALSCFPVGEAEGFVIGKITDIFRPFDVSPGDGTIHLSNVTYRLYNAARYFIGVALLEELGKWIILVAVTRKSKHFNSLFDGLIYSVFVSLGFAGLENIMYVTRYGWMTAYARAFTAVPGHMFFGVLMGYWYSMWHMHSKARGVESLLISIGKIDGGRKPFPTKRYAVFSLVAPVIAHGLYDYCCTIDTKLAVVAFYVVVSSLYIYCFGKIWNMSDTDVSAGTYTSYLVNKKYPELSARSSDEAREKEAEAAQWGARV